MTPSRDLYEVLGVPRGASATDLKKAYRQRAIQYHPDKCPGDKSAEDKFKEAANAYQILSDETKRAAYDRHGHGFGGAAAPEGFRDVEDIFTTFGDLFGDFFTGRSGRKASARGADIRLDLELSFAEAVAGTRKDIQISRTASCSTCRGTGDARSVRAETCRQCMGKGQVVHSQGYFMVQTTCSSCRGSGRTIGDPCSACRGKGVRPEVSTLSLTVPAGVDDGQQLRVAGKGECAAGGTSGDLYVTLRVEEDDRFEREGGDITSVVAINFAQAALGGKIEIDTLDGTVILELAPGTQPGEVVVRQGQGIAHPDRGGRGDHLVEFVIEVPKKLTSKLEKILHELAAELDSGKRAKARRKSR